MQARTSILIGGWVTYPQCSKLLLQGHVAHGLGARARLASTETSSQDYFSEEAAENVLWRFY